MSNPWPVHLLCNRWGSAPSSGDGGVKTHGARTGRYSVTW